MSNSTSPASELAQYEMSYEVYFHFQDFAFASATLLFYSHIITFDKEVQQIWRNPMRPGALLYILMRYPALLERVILLTIPTIESNSTCTATERAQDVLWTIALASSYAFQILRTYAIFPRVRTLVVFLVVLCLPTMAYEIWQLIVLDCATTTGDGIQRAMATIQITTDLAFESLVLFATLVKTWTLVSELKRFELGPTSLAETMLRNGIFYYVIIVAADLGGLITTNIEINAMTESASIGFGDLSQPLRLILLSQFILDLRERATPQHEILSGMTQSRAQDTIHFVQDMVTQDFGEALYPLPSVDQRKPTSPAETDEIELVDQS